MASQKQYGSQRVLKHGDRQQTHTVPSSHFLSIKRMLHGFPISNGLTLTHDFGVGIFGRLERLHNQQLA